MTSIGKKALSERGGYAQRPLRSFFLEKLLYFRERRLFYGEVLLSRIKLPVKC